MIIVADENIDIAIIERLRKDGHDVYSVSEETPGFPDDSVLSVVRERRALLLTEDKDFVEMIFHKEEYRDGVVLVRLDGCLSKDKANIVSKAIFDHGHELGNAITAVTSRAIRIRKFH